MLVQDPFSGYLHEVPDALAHYGDYGDYGYSYYNGYDEYLDPSVAEYQGELGYFGLPFLAPIISAAASALPQVLPTIASSVINAVTGGGAPPPPPPVQQFAPPNPLLPLGMSVINAVTGGGAPPPPPPNQQFAPSSPQLPPLLQQMLPQQMLSPMTSGGPLMAVARPAVLLPQQMLSPMTSGGVFAPPPGLRAFIYSVVRDVMAEESPQPGAGPMMSPRGYRRRRRR